MHNCHDCMKPRVAIFATICAAALAMPLFADPVQVDPADYECTFNVKFVGYRGTSTLADFPVLIRLSKALNGFNYAKCAGGANLRFADSDGNMLMHEIDTWDASGESLVWVKVPSLTKETVIKVLYGYKGAGEQPAVTASDVWSNGYIGVWHLGSSGNLTQKDSTSNGHDFVCASGDTDKVDLAAAGAIGGAVGFSKGGAKKGGLQVNDSGNAIGTSMDTTFEMWLCQTNVDTTANRAILSKRTAWNSGSYYFYARKEINGSPALSPSMSADDPTLTYPPASAVDLVYGEWKHIAFTRTGADGRLTEYADGGYIYYTTAGGTGCSLYPQGEIPVVLGNDRTSSNSSYLGYIDEVRISSVARSADWVQATRDCVEADGFAVYSVENDWTKYSHRFTVSFPGYEGGEELEDFPVLVKISESEIAGFKYADCLRPNGGDLRFADANGNLLFSDVDTWNTNGVSLVWVKVPSLNAGTKITAYYGWNMAPAVDATAVWANGYLGVWHMNGGLGDSGYVTLVDATGGGSTFTEDYNSKGSATLGQEGVVGHSVLFGIGVNGGGGMRNESARVMRAGTSAFTAELWAWQDDHVPSEASKDGALMRELTTDNSTYPTVYRLYEAASTGNKGKIVLNSGFASGEAYATPGGSMPLAARAEWNYHAAKYDAEAGGKVMLNGSMTVAQSAAGDFRAPLTRTTLFLANYTCSDNKVWPGRIDEVRISSVARSDAWVKATYDTIKNNTTFTTYGEARPNDVKGLMIIIR